VLVYDCNGNHKTATDQHVLSEFALVTLTQCSTYGCPLFHHREEEEAGPREEKNKRGSCNNSIVIGTPSGKEWKKSKKELRSSHLEPLQLLSH
jgi:hypothetical protein